MNVAWQKSLRLLVADSPPAAAAYNGHTAIVERIGWLVLAGLVLVWFVFSYGYIEDDAFIHLEFARSLEEGHGFAFNGLITNGDTAPLWVCLLLGIHALGLPWIVSAKVACSLGLCIAASGTWLLAKAVAGTDYQRRHLPLATTAITVLNPFFVHWSFSGMESVTALGVSLWMIYTTFTGAPSRVRFLLGAMLVGIGPLLRPELLLLGGICGPALLWRQWQLLAGVQQRRRYDVIIGVALMTIPLALWSGYALRTFGSVVPNTNVAKRGGAIAELGPRLLFVYAVGFPVTLIVAPVLTALRRKSIPLVIWVLLLWPVACVVFYLLDHTVVQTRYCLLSMPSMSLAVLWLAASWERQWMFRSTSASMALAALAVICCIVIPHIENKKEYGRALSRISLYIHDNLPPNSRVAVFAIGQVAFEGRHPIVDIGGITRPSVIPLLADPQATLRWAQAQGADYVISSNPPLPESRMEFSTTVPFLGWTWRRTLYGQTGPLCVYRI
jgi:hypothetical protein